MFYERTIQFGLGMEIHNVPGGVEIAQHGFISELLRSYNHKGLRSWSQGSRDMMALTPEEEEAILNAEPVNLEGREAEFKQAQKRVGELLWLTGGSRPDLQYITSIMSSRITRVPELVNELGDRLLNYLAKTQCYCLSFVKSDDFEQRLDLLPPLEDRMDVRQCSGDPRPYHGGHRANNLSLSARLKVKWLRQWKERRWDWQPSVYFKNFLDVSYRCISGLRIRLLSLL